MSGAVVKPGNVRGKGLAKKYRELVEWAQEYGYNDYEISTIIQPNGEKILVLDINGGSDGGGGDHGEQNL